MKFRFVSNLCLTSEARRQPPQTHLSREKFFKKVIDKRLGLWYIYNNESEKNANQPDKEGGTTNKESDP